MNAVSKIAAAAAVIDWTKPLEHVDGTPLVFARRDNNPDLQGDYFLSREDGKFFTPQQGPSWLDMLIISPNGHGWSNFDTGVPLVRNRADTAQPNPPGFGDAISVDGVRPDWLRDDDRIMDSDPGKPTDGEVRTPAGWKWKKMKAIRLRADHPYYLATSKGFTYWPGGDAAPADWDRGEALCANESICPGPFVTDWQTVDKFYSIIGYRRKFQAQPTELETLRADFERSQDELATVTADRDEWIAAFRDLHARCMRQEHAASEVLRMSAQSGAFWAAAASSPETVKPEPGSVYVFGPWVTVRKGTAGPGVERFYQVLQDCGAASQIYEGNGLPWSRNVKLRRAYRIGEWHEWEGGECPLPYGTLFQVKNTCGHEVAKPHTAGETMTAWQGEHQITAFRVLPPAAAARIFPITGPAFFHLGADAAE